MRRFRTASLSHNLRVLDELVERFRNRAPQPIKGWPDFDTYLDSMRFPATFLPTACWPRRSRLTAFQAIRDALLHPGRDGRIVVRHVAPWTDEDAIERSSVDLIYSHSVLEHVVDVRRRFDAAASWLREDGCDVPPGRFHSHGRHQGVERPLAVPRVALEIIVGGRPFLINRHSATTQIRMLEAAGFKIVKQMRTTATTGCLDPSSACPGKTC